MLTLMSLSLALSCATRQESPQASALVSPPHAASLSMPAAPRPRASPSKAVRASYQGDAYAGRRTASGERHDPNALTAASTTLPLGSSMMVTNPATGHSVKVRINDREPNGHGRSLDLSKRAAEELGMTKKGVARVEIKHAASTPASGKSPKLPANSSSTSTPKS
jgi:rare lipoprotein A